MMQKYPQSLPTTIEKGAYNGIDQPIETVGTGAMFACRADLPDDLVYEIVKTVYSQEGVDYLGNVIAALKSMSPNLAVSYKPIPLHPGRGTLFPRNRPHQGLIYIRSAPPGSLGGAFPLPLRKACRGIP